MSGCGWRRNANVDCLFRPRLLKMFASIYRFEWMDLSWEKNECIRCAVKFDC